MNPGNELIHLSHLDTMLARATNVQELNTVRAIAEAARTYAIHIKESREKCKEYAAVRLRAERKCGQMLTTLNIHGSNQHSRKSDSPTSLLEYRITKDESYRWRTIAKLPDDLFERLILGCIENSEQEITTDYFFENAKIHLMRMRGIDTDRPAPEPKEVKIDEKLAAYMFQAGIDALNEANAFGRSLDVGMAAYEAIAAYKAQKGNGNE